MQTLLVTLYTLRFISTVGIDFREKKITWRGPKNENSEKLVKQLKIYYNDSAAAACLDAGSEPAYPAAAVGHGGPGEVPQPHHRLLQVSGHVTRDT